jgi:hypothetical protein
MPKPKKSPPKMQVRINAPVWKEYTHWCEKTIEGRKTNYLSTTSRFNYWLTEIISKSQ